MAKATENTEKEVELIDGAIPVVSEPVGENESAEAPENTTPPTPQKRRGRGRPAGSTNKRKATTARGQKAELEKLGRQAVGAHMMIAGLTGMPELQITEAEGVALAEVLMSGAEEFGFEISGKAGFVIQALATVAMIYGPRLIMIQRRLYAPQPEQREEPQQPVPANYPTGPIQ